MRGSGIRSGPPCRRPLPEDRGSDVEPPIPAAGDDVQDPAAGEVVVERAGPAAAGQLVHRAVVSGVEWGGDQPRR